MATRVLLQKRCARRLRNAETGPKPTVRVGYKVFLFFFHSFLSPIRPLRGMVSESLKDPYNVGEDRKAAIGNSGAVIRNNVFMLLDATKVNR